MVTIRSSLFACPSLLTFGSVTNTIFECMEAMSACRLLATASCSAFGTPTMRSSPVASLSLTLTRTMPPSVLFSAAIASATLLLWSFSFYLERQRLREQVRVLRAEHEGPDELVVDLAGRRGVELPEDGMPGR